MSPPTPEALAKGLALIARSNANYHYFFQTLDDPEWIQPLLDRGFFKKPPSSQRNGNHISFPSWPESLYLARMAKHPQVQEQILAVASSVATDNPRIHEDLAAIAVSLPPKAARKLAPRARAWLESPYKSSRLTDRLVTVIAQLAQGGEMPSALALTRSVFHLVSGRAGTDAEDDVLPVEAVPLIGTFHYARALLSVREGLVAAAGLRALGLFSDLLDLSFAISRKKDDEPGQDYSFVWCPDLDSIGDDTARDVLVATVRDSVEQLAEAEAAAIAEVIGALEQRKWTIYRRLALHLLRKYPRNPELISARLRAAPPRGAEREYQLLAKDHFASLDPAARAERLSLIRAPDIERIKQNYRDWVGEALSDDQADAIASEWERDELAPLADGLPTSLRARYDELVRKLGPPPPAGALPHRISVGTGPGSPKSLPELRSMDVNELVEFVRAWAPDGRPIERSREGLGRVLTERVAESPGEFAAAADGFLDLDPTYVRALFQGLWDACRNARSFDWRPVLRAAKVVIDRPRDIPGRVGGLLEGQDPGWGWCRSTIARLISAGTQEKAPIPISLRDDVAGILTSLSVDPIPTAEDEAKALSEGDADPMELAMNTTRGEAMGAVFDCIPWLRRAIPESTLRDMPEIAAILDRHLDVRSEPSLAIRAVYGEHLPLLVYIDPEWTQANLDRILPRVPERTAYWRAAWDAYLAHSRQYDPAFDTLAAHYAYAIDDLPVDKPALRRRGEIEHRLVEHVCLLYAHGKLDLSEGGVIARLFDRPRPDLRAYALEFIGRVMGSSKDVPVDVISRFVRFWGWFVKRYDGSASVESAAFGWWMLSARFEEAWTLDQVLAILSVTGKIDPVYGVLDRLADLATGNPEKSVACLRLIVENASPEEGLFGMEDQIRGILERVLSTMNPAAQEAATRLIHRLGHLGYTSLRDLASRHP